jgi:hypothetical protein
VAEKYISKTMEEEKRGKHGSQVVGLLYQEVGKKCLVRKQGRKNKKRKTWT